MHKIKYTVDPNHSRDFHPAVVLPWLAVITEYYYEMVVNVLNVCSKTILPSDITNKRIYLQCLSLTNITLDRPPWPRQLTSPTLPAFSIWRVSITQKYLMNCSLYHFRAILKISSKSIHKVTTGFLIGQSVW